MRPQPAPPSLQTTTLWDHPTREYRAGKFGSRNYTGSTPPWILWNLLTRYTKAGDIVVDPMCGSGTTIDVATDLGRVGRGFDINITRPDVEEADARSLPMKDASADFVFVDPPYSTHVDYSDDPRCLGKLHAVTDAYYAAMRTALSEMHRVLKTGGYMALYVSDSHEKAAGFFPIGFELFSIMREFFTPVDIIAVVRHNRKLNQGNFHKAAEEGNFFLRGFTYLFIMQKEDAGMRQQRIRRAKKQPKKAPTNFRAHAPMQIDEENS